MTKMKIPFSPPNISEDAIAEVISTLRSGWITTGPKTKKFEDQLTSYCGNQRTLCVGSGTFGLERVLNWYDIKPGDEVIIPAYTYCATANVVMHLGATPVLADIEERSFNISPDEVEKKITSKTKAIIPVDFGGYPCNYDELYRIVNSKSSVFQPRSINQEKLGRILLLSDAAHSLGAIYKSKKSGTLCDISVFSFHAVKNLTTGEGGAIALNLEEPFDNNLIYNYQNIMSLHGQSKDAFQKSKSTSWKYDVIAPGYKGNMTDIQASLGLVALKHYDSIELAARKKIFSSYNQILKDTDWAIVPLFKTLQAESSYHLYPLRIAGFGEKQRDDLIQLMAEDGISTNVHFQPLPLLHAYKSVGYDMNDFPVSYHNYSHEISLPVYSLLNLSKVEYIIHRLISNVEKIL